MDKRLKVRLGSFLLIIGLIAFLYGFLTCITRKPCIREMQVFPIAVIIIGLILLLMGLVIILSKSEVKIKKANKAFIFVLIIPILTFLSFISIFFCMGGDICDPGVSFAECLVNEDNGKIQIMLVKGGPFYNEAGWNNVVIRINGFEVIENYNNWKEGDSFIIGQDSEGNYTLNGGELPIDEYNIMIIIEDTVVFDDYMKID